MDVIAKFKGDQRPTEIAKSVGIGRASCTAFSMMQGWSEAHHSFGNYLTGSINFEAPGFDDWFPVR